MRVLGRRPTGDIAAGAVRLRELLDEIPPIFTPPWNRCTQATGLCLLELGFQALVRDAGAARLELAGLQELEVSVDAPAPFGFGNVDLPDVVEVEQLAQQLADPRRSDRAGARKVTPGSRPLGSTSRATSASAAARSDTSSATTYRRALMPSTSTPWSSPASTSSDTSWRRPTAPYGTSPSSPYVALPCGVVPYQSSCEPLVPSRPWPR